eukprot:706109-Amphidinium_carterae.1
MMQMIKHQMQSAAKFSRVNRVALSVSPHLQMPKCLLGNLMSGQMFQCLTVREQSRPVQIRNSASLS